MKLLTPVERRKVEGRKWKKGTEEEEMEKGIRKRER